jgi:hypothetical protein
MRLIDKLKAQEKLVLDSVPYKVARAFTQPRLEVVGDQVCIGEDYLTLDEAREAIAWYVDQLGGKVVWSKK